MLAARLGSRTLLVDVGQTQGACIDAQAARVRRLAMLAVPLGIRIACSAAPAGASDDGPAIDRLVGLQRIVDRSAVPNVGLVLEIDAVPGRGRITDSLDAIDPMRVLLARVSDRISGAAAHLGDRPAVLPGWGDATDNLVATVRALDRAGYRGVWVLDAGGPAYRSLTLDAIAGQARRSAIWLAEGALRRSVPLPARIRRFPLNDPGEMS